MATETKTQIEGLDSYYVEEIRSYFECANGGIVPTLEEIHRAGEHMEEIEQKHLDEFERQVVEGHRCTVDGKHESEVVLVPSIGSERICEDHADQ